VRSRTAKFAALNKAFLTNGAFIFVPDGVDVSDPIVVGYETAGASAFPYTLVVAGEGSRCTVVERVGGNAALVCGVAEIVSAPTAAVHYASVQTLAADSRTLYTRHALPGKDASIAWNLAELGAGLSVCDVLVRIEQSGVQADIVALFFPSQRQHVDLITAVEHSVGQAQSNTLVKSAATGFGQGRYLGNIRIAPSAHGTEAALKDDALLLSKTAHIDSVPALEIAANDVKAFHGATVGAIDDTVLFYMMSRGIDRSTAEKIITLGFFEPAITRFPGESLREEIRSELETKTHS
jgi:Fe-S cluster assembly protein SufD